MDNRVVALSVLEDLLLWPLPPRDGVVTAPDDIDGAEFLDEDELAMARLAAEENSLEPRAVREARYRAVLQLPHLCAKLGPRWTRAEVVPYLLRCLEEEDAPLSFAVGVVLIGLVHPHATTDAERDRLAKDRAQVGGYPGHSSAATTTADESSDRTQSFLSLEEVLPVVERLGACREGRLRAFAAQVVVPHMCFGVPLEEGSALEGWDRKYLLPVHMMQSLEDQRAGAVGGGDEDEDVTESLGASAVAAAGADTAAPAANTAVHSSVRRAAVNGTVDPRQRVLRQLDDVLTQYRERTETLRRAGTVCDGDTREAAWTPLDGIYQKLSAYPHTVHGDRRASGKTALDEGIYQALFALEAGKLSHAAEVQLNFLTPYLDRLSDAGVRGQGGRDGARHAEATSAKTTKASALFLQSAPLSALGISYASDNLGSAGGRGPVDPFTLNVRARALVSDVAAWFGLVTAGACGVRRHTTAADYLEASDEVRTALVGRWQALLALLERLLASTWPGAVAVGVESITSLLHALTQALGFSRRTATYQTATLSSPATVMIVAPPAVPLRLDHDAQLFHVLTTHLHLALCITAAVEAGAVAGPARSARHASRVDAEGVWARLNDALPHAINALYARLYAHRLFLLNPVQMLGRVGTEGSPLNASPAWLWLVQLGPGPLEARMPMLATWDIAFATQTRTGQPDDVAVLLLRDDDDDADDKEGTRDGSSAAPRLHAALSAETEAGWRRGVAGIASAFRLPHVLRLSILRCLPLLVSLDPCFGVGQGSSEAVADTAAAATPSSGAETPAATLDTVVRLLAQVMAPPAALPQLLSEVLLAAAVLNGDASDACGDEGGVSSPRGSSGRSAGTAAPVSARSATGMHRSRRASCFSPTSQSLTEVPPASPRAPHATGSATTPQATTPSPAHDASEPFAALLASPVQALVFASSSADVDAAATARTGESPASVDYSLLEVVMAAVEKVFVRVAVLLTAELSSYTDAVVSGRLRAAATVPTVTQRVTAVVRLLFLLYQATVRYTMTRASWKARWLLVHRLPSLTAGFLYVLVSIAHYSATPTPAWRQGTTAAPATGESVSGMMLTLRESLEALVGSYYSYTCELLTAAWSGPQLGEPGVLFSLLSDDEAEVCYLSTHCLSGVFGELTQAALRLATSVASRRAHARTAKAAPPQAGMSASAAQAAAQRSALEASRAEYAAALQPFLGPLLRISTAAVEGCRLNLSDPLPRVRCGAVKGLSLLSGVLSDVVAVSHYYAAYSPTTTTTSDTDTEGEARALSSRLWSEALTRTTQTLLSAMNDDSSVVQLSLVSELSYFLIRQGGEAQSGDGGRDAEAEASQQVRHEALLRCLRGLARHDVWRYRARYAVLLAEMCFCFLTASAASLQKLAREELLPLLVNTLFDKVKAVRDTALTATTKLCARVYAISAAGRAASSAPVANDFVNSTLWPIIYQAPCAWDTYLSRSALLQVALCLGVDKKTTMLPLLQKLAKDSVLNVRLVVAKTILQVLLADSAGGTQGAGVSASATSLSPTAASTTGSGGSGGGAVSRAPAVEPAGATTYALLMGKPLLFSTIRQVRAAHEGPRRHATSTNRGGSASTSGGNSDGAAPGDLAGASEDLALPLVTFTTAEKNGVVLELLRELIEDPSGDVRDEAAKALHVCF